MEQLRAACLPGMSASPSIIAAIVYLLAQSYYQQPQNAEKLSGITTHSSDMLECVEYIDRHYMQPLSLGKLAKKFGFSQSAFCAAFPPIVGMPLTNALPISGSRRRRCSSGLTPAGH